MATSCPRSASAIAGVSEHGPSHGASVRVLVHFGEERVDSRGRRGPGEQRHELPLPAGLAVPVADGSCTECVASKHTASPASRIWAKPAHVHHEIVVAEATRPAR